MRVSKINEGKKPALPLTSGHVNEKVFLLGLVPSTVATAICLTGSIHRDKTLQGRTRRTGQENHVKVISRHEVDVHGLPNTGRVDIPANRTRLSLDEDIARTGVVRVGVGTDINGSGEKGQNGRDCGEHFSLSFTVMVPRNGPCLKQQEVSIVSIMVNAVELRGLTLQGMMTRNDWKGE